jgi:hypothetical protein
MEAARFFFWTSSNKTINGYSLGMYGGFGDLLRMTANVVRPHIDMLFYVACGYRLCTPSC